MPRKRPRIKVNIPVDDGSEDRRKIYASIISFFATFINIYIFLAIGCQTLIPTNWLIASYFLLGIVGFLVLKKRKVKQSALKAYVVFPLSINIILCLNYFISFNEQKETYKFHRSYYWAASGRTNLSQPDRQMSTQISFDNNKYEDFWGIRTFISVENIGPTERITYTFKRGILGLRVMTDYEF
ncbi:MAG: hypothetical protein J0L69_08775 [Bacteroidetes bacterium]|nr:hypothetical protein [Bacteroidota bacterium]